MAVGPSSPGGATGTPPGQRRVRLVELSSATASGLVIGVLLVVMSSSFAALVFSGPLEVHLQKGIGLNLAASVVALTVVGLLSSFRGAIAGPQDVTGAILGLAAASIASRMPPTESATFLTVVLLLGVTSLLTGGFFLALGMFRLGDLVRYVPYPVVGGFLAGTGWLLLKGGVGIVTGTPLSWSTLDAYTVDANLVKWGLATAFAAALVWAVRRYHHPLVVPVGLAALVVGFYLAVLAAGSSLSEAEAGGWLLGPFPESGLWRPWAFEAVVDADWGALGSQAATVLSTVVVAVLGLLLNASGIEMATDRDLDLNRELRAAGAANLLVGAAGGMPAYQKIGATVLAHALGTTTRLVALVAAGVCGVTLAFGGSVLSFFPRLALGGLLAYLGLALLVEWVYDASLRLRRVEYVLVLVILLVVAGVGFLAGVAVGTAVAVVLFVLDSSRGEVVHVEFPGSALPSNVERAVTEQSVVAARADAIHVVRLQGFLFFGTANRLLQRLRRRAEDRAQVPLEFLVLDFKRVGGIDSSAVLSFVKATRLGRALGFTIVLTGVGPVIARQLTRGGKGSTDDLRFLPDVDRGVQWCEDRILREQEIARPAATSLATLDLTSSTVNGKRLSDYFEELELPEGHLLIREGDASDDLFVLHSGRLTSVVEQPGGGTVRLGTMGPGTIVGEVGLYGGVRTASVVTEAPSTLSRLSRAGLDALERDDPRAAAHLHRAIAALMARRLASTLRSLRAFTD